MKTPHVGAAATPAAAPTLPAWLLVTRALEDRAMSTRDEAVTR